MANLATITNTSHQPVPVLVNAIDSEDALATSDIPASRAEQLTIPPGKQLRIELIRIDRAQLDRLRQLNVITYITS